LSTKSLSPSGEKCVEELLRIGAFLDECVDAAEQVLENPSLLETVPQRDMVDDEQRLVTRISNIVEALAAGEEDDGQTNLKSSDYRKEDAECTSNDASGETAWLESSSASLDVEISSKRAELARLQQRFSDLRERMKEAEEGDEGEEEHKALYEAYVSKYKNLEFLKFEIGKLSLLND